MITPEIVDVQISELDFALSTGEGPYCPPEIVYRQSGVLFKEYHFTTPLLEWRVSHGMGQTRFLEKITDSEGRTILVSLEDLTENGFTVRFSEPEAGKIILMFEAPESTDLI